jgi:site-specific recombinase XerC
MFYAHYKLFMKILLIISTIYLKSHDTTATYLIEAGVALAVVKNILGHSSIQSTQIYVEISQQTVDQSVKKWNEKWFTNDGIKEELLPKMQSSLPEFLQ